MLQVIPALATWEKSKLIYTAESLLALRNWWRQSHQVLHFEREVDSIQSCPYFYFFPLHLEVCIASIHIPVTAYAKMNKAREFQLQRKATADHPMALLPVRPQGRGSLLGGVFIAAASQHNSPLLLSPMSLNQS